MRLSWLIILKFLTVCPACCKFAKRRCTSKDIKNLINNVVDEVSTSPDFQSSKESLGVIANILKRRVQLRNKRVYEIIVSRKNFAVASYSVGDQFCKRFRNGIYTVAYATPHQSGYNASDAAAEMEFSSISNPDPLGTDSSLLPGQIKAMGVELEMDGYRLGFPKGSHCDLGMKGGHVCCHQELFQSMHNTVINMEEDDSYFSVDRRVIAQRIRRAAEIAINQPLELLISPKDFVVASNHRGNCICKFKAGKNTIMAWRTPGNWSVGVDLFADNGRSSFRGCNRTERAVGQKSNGCCNGTLQYAMMKNLEEAAGGVDGGEVDVNEISRSLARNTQKQLNSHVETIVSRGDFIHRTGNTSMADQACKLNLRQYQVMMFQSPGKPLDTEFLSGDVEPSNSLESIMSNGENSPNVGKNTGNGNTPNGNPSLPAPNTNPSSNSAQLSLQNVVNQPGSQSFLQQQAVPQQSIGQAAPSQHFSGQQLVPQQFPLQQTALQQLPRLQQGAQQIYPPQSFSQFAPQQTYYSGGDYVDPFYRYRCFSEDTWVITETGKKNMSDLKIGDFVMTANSRESFFLPIIMWLHKSEDADSGFMEVQTAKRHLFISPRHFIYRTNCSARNINYDEENRLILPKSGEIFAQDLIPGDCVYVYHGEKWLLEKIVSLKMKEKRGLYAPLTENGKIVVNGILASCFTDIHEPIIQSVYFDFITRIRNYMTRLFGWYGDDQVGVPSFLDIFEDLHGIVLPYSNQFKN